MTMRVVSFLGGAAPVEEQKSQKLHSISLAAAKEKILCVFLRQHSAIFLPR